MDISAHDCSRIIEEYEKEVKRLKKKNVWLGRRIIDLTDTCNFKEKRIEELKAELAQYRSQGAPA